MIKLVFIFLFFWQPMSCFSQTISTFFSNSNLKIDDAMVLDSAGNLYGSHFMGTNIVKVTPDGIGSIFATGFNTPNGLAFDSNNNLFVCDLSGNRIYKLSSDGDFLDTFNVSTPSGIIKSFDSDTMLFTQYTGNKLSKLAPDGTISIIASGTPMVGSVGLTYSNTGQLYVANFTDRKIYSFGDTGFNYVATVPGPSNGALGFITFSKGSLWGTSYNGHKIYRIYPEYVDSVALLAGSTIGSTDGAINNAKFNTPNGIISSKNGDSLYVSDFGTGRVRIIALNESLGLTDYNINPKKVLVTPNPAADFIHLNIDFEKIEVVNQIGEIVLTTSNSCSNIENLPSGIYLIKIYREKDLTFTRFIKN